MQTCARDGQDEARTAALAEALVRARQLEIAFENTRHGLLPLGLSVVCYAGLLAQAVPRGTITAWLVLMLLLIGARAGLLLAYRRAGDKSHRRWVYYQGFSLAAIGTAYGITPCFIPLPPASWLIAVANLWLGGLAVSILVGQGIVRPLGLAFAIPALAPVLVLLLASGDPVLVSLGLGNVLLYAYLYGVVGRTQACTLQEARHRVLYASLAERLERQRAHSEALVAKLTREVARRKKVQAALTRARDAAQTLSNEDHLTGLANQRVFDRVLAREWARARRDQRPLSLILCDIDRFRAYNERYGHHAGDGCLKRIAGVVAGFTRRAGDLVARYGGEEFAILLPETSEYAALDIAEAIRSRVYEQTILHGASEVDRIVTASCGVATIIPEVHGHEHDLLEAAAHALRRAKHAGRNCVYTVYGALALDEG